MSDATTLLFGLPGVAVQRVEGVRVVHVATADPTAAACPDCGVFSTVVRQRRTTRPRDLAYGEEPLAVRWHQRQYACTEPACPREAFTESIAELPPYARVTGRLGRAAAVVEAGTSVAAAVRAHGLSWPVTHAAFTARADPALAAPDPVEALGIDETRRGRPRWATDPETGRWVWADDHDGHRLAGRPWRAGVRWVAMDPCASYRSAVSAALPNATIVADHFHLVRLANQAVTRVRQRVTWESLGRRGTQRDPVWANRRRLLRGRQRLSPAAFTRMWNDALD